VGCSGPGKAGGVWAGDCVCQDGCPFGTGGRVSGFGVAPSWDGTNADASIISEGPPGAARMKDPVAVSIDHTHPAPSTAVRDVIVSRVCS